MENIFMMKEGDSLYGALSKRVKEILPTPVFSDIPCKPEYLTGITSYKGKIVPIISLGVLVGQGDISNEKVCCIIDVEGKIIGITCEDIQLLKNDEEKEILESKTEFSGRYLHISCIIKDKQPIFLLDLPKMISIMNEEE